jgi:hypothetical protein
MAQGGEQRLGMSVPQAISPRYIDGARVPDFFIVGHAKSGTTALYEMLRSHPQIYMPEAKEPWFFASDMRPRFRPAMAGALPETLEEYLSLFAGASSAQRAGEASSSYLWSKTAAGAIAEVQPQARIVAILREPASFLRSLHMQLLQTHVENVRDLRRAIELEGERRAGRHIPRRSHRPQLLQYSSLVDYFEQLRRYRDLFGEEHVLVLIYEDFRADNQGAVGEVLRLLEVEQQSPIEIVEANPSVRIRSQQLDDIVHAVSVGRGPAGRLAQRALKAITPRGVRRSALRYTQRRVVHASPDAADEAFMLELRRRFKPQVAALSEYLGRDLVGLWRYDRLD